MFARQADISEREIPLFVQAIEPGSKQRWRSQEQRRNHHPGATKELQPIQQPARQQSEIAAYRFDGVVFKSGSFEQVFQTVPGVAEIIVGRLMHLPFMRHDQQQASLRTKRLVNLAQRQARFTEVLERQQC